MRLEQILNGYDFAYHHGGVEIEDEFPEVTSRGSLSESRLMNSRFRILLGKDSGQEWHEYLGSGRRIRVTVETIE